MAHRIQMSALPITVRPRASYFSLPAPQIPQPKMEVATTHALLSYDKDCWLSKLLLSGAQFFLMNLM